jgi:DNA-binding GntR family transcriptional regulator
MSPINNISAGQAVYRCLRSAILSGKFVPGERLVERQLSVQLDVSHIPVREALKMLERDGLVQFTPFKGAQVIKLEPHELDQFYNVRAVLEGFAARLAAANITDEGLRELESLLDAADRADGEDKIPEVARINAEFHRLIGVWAQNGVLTDFLDRIRSQIHFFMLQSLGTGDRPKHTHEEHRRILAALAQHDPVRSEEAAVSHILSALRTIQPQTDHTTGQPERRSA